MSIFLYFERKYKVLIKIANNNQPAREYLGEGGGVQTTRNFHFFLKSERKEVERKNNEKGWGGEGLIVNIFFRGLDFFEWG